MSPHEHTTLTMTTTTEGLTPLMPNIDVSFMLVATALVQLMTPGLGIFYAGLCRPKGAVTVMGMSIAAMGIVTCIWFVFTFGLAFGPAWDSWNLIGNPWPNSFFGGMNEYEPAKIPGTDTMYGSPDLPGWLYALYQNKFAVITPALASGASVDRFRLIPWIIFIVLWSILVYAPWCHAIWGGGYYAGRGVVDFAGGIVVHTTSGWSALAIAKVLGHRVYKDDRPHSVPLVVLGTAILWFGWFGFNAGSAYSANGVAVLAALNSQMAAAAGMVMWAWLHWSETGKLGVIPLCIGCIAGLATITPGAGFVRPSESLIFGVLGALIGFYSIKIAKSGHFDVDDALDVWAVHGMGGGLGSVLIGIFTDPSACAGLGVTPAYCENPVSPDTATARFAGQLEATCVCALHSIAASLAILWFIGKFMDIIPEEHVDENTGEMMYDFLDDDEAPRSVTSAAYEPPKGCWEQKPDGSRAWKISDMLPLTQTAHSLPTLTGLASNTSVMPVGSSDSRLAGLPQRGKVMAEYVWLGGAETTGGFDIRSKSRTFDKMPGSVSELPVWNFDGSSTGQAPGADSEVSLKPVAVYPDPFRGGQNILVLCECIDPSGKPIPTNTRSAAAIAFSKALSAEPWFGIEQEYTLFEKDGVTPLGWPVGGEPKPQGPYYCSAGYDVSYGRNVMETHYRVCMYAGLNISGTNAEVMPGQWEYQVGPCTGINAGDQLWMSRYLMIRVCELLEVNVSFDPKPIPGEWNGAGCHTNFSTAAMRKPGGFKEIIKAIEKLGPKHEEHIRVYGEGNDRRLTGRCETAAIGDFSYGVANRGASVRIPRSAEKDGCGYFEDRRPASNMDPYLVTGKIFQTTVLE